MMMLEQASDYLRTTTGVAAPLRAAAALGTVLVVAKGVSWWVGRRKLSRARDRWNKVGKDVVVLHQLPRAIKCLNLSPFPLKLETFLRMHKIRYVTESAFPMSSKGKTPWITLNGVDVADSQLALEHLAAHFGIDTMAGLSPADRAVARSMRIMMEDHLYWWAAWVKWVRDGGQCMMTQMRIPKSFLVRRVLIPWAFWGVKRNYARYAYCQGMGRHTPEQIDRMGRDDVKALSDFLKDKPYLMGDSPSEVDCIAFAMVAILLFAPMDDNMKSLTDEYPNLVKYCIRMKEVHFPDWDQILDHDMTILS